MPQCPTGVGHVRVTLSSNRTCCYPHGGFTGLGVRCGRGSTEGLSWLTCRGLVIFEGDKQRLTRESRLHMEGHNLTCQKHLGFLSPGWVGVNDAGRFLSPSSEHPWVSSPASFLPLPGTHGAAVRRLPESRQAAPEMCLCLCSRLSGGISHGMSLVPCHQLSAPAHLGFSQDDPEQHQSDPPGLGYLMDCLPPAPRPLISCSDLAGLLQADFWLGAFASAVPSAWNALASNTHEDPSTPLGVQRSPCQ